MTDLERLTAVAASLGYVVVPATQWQATQDVVESAASAALHVADKDPREALWRDLSRLDYHDRPKLGLLSRAEEAQHEKLVAMLTAMRGA